MTEARATTEAAFDNATESDPPEPNGGTGYWDPKGMVAVARAMRVEVDAFPPQHGSYPGEPEMYALVDEGAVKSGATRAQRDRVRTVAAAGLKKVLAANRLSRDELVDQYLAAYPERAPYVKKIR